MAEVNIEERIQKRCLSLASDLAKAELELTDQDLMLRLLRRGMPADSKAKACRRIYEWLTCHKFDSDTAWQLSGLGSIVENSV